MAEESVLISRQGAVLTLTLHRPKPRNSFTEAMHAELAAALDAAAADTSVGCVVMTGAGRGFCAGQDFSDPTVAQRHQPGAEPPDMGDAVERPYKPLALRVRAMPGPSYVEALRHEGRWQRTPGAAADCREGVAAFMAKRAPLFTER